jgi:hypothetical protein
MEINNEETILEKEMDKIIVKILLPITDKLKSKTREIKEKRLELKRQINNIRQLKQALIDKKNKLKKQKLIYENNLNGDFSNVKTCRECLINYINIIDKKQSDFLKKKDDYYELKLRQKQLEFNNLLIDLIKEKTNIEQKKKYKRKMSFDIPKKFNQSSNSIQRNLNKSFASDTNENSKNKKVNKSVTSNHVLRTKPINNSSNKENKNHNKKKDNKVIKSNNNINNDDKFYDISGEIEKLINNYSTKKSGIKSIDSVNSENYNDGLTQLKEINKDTKSIENDLKEMMENI